ncbi:MAG: HD-GYP domain-containing protein [Sphingobium sp.]
MLKRITPEQVMLGMFIHKFEGGWMSHPFWRAGFLLEDARDLQEIRTSDIAAVWIDEKKSARKFPTVRATKAITSGEAIAMRIRAARSEMRPASPRQSPLQEDRSAAAHTVARSKQIMRQVFDAVRLGRIIRSADVMSVINEISASLTRNRSMLIGVTRLKTKDEYTYLHSVAVCALMVNLAREIGLNEAETRDAGMAGLLHDVGKMAIPVEILNKPGRLTQDEFREIKEHTTKGHRMLTKGSGIPEAALDVCLNHHEKIDGTGYPRGLSADSITLFARMGAICDVYDAMTSRRAYKPPSSPTETIAAMHAAKGHFDSALLFRFMKSVGAYPTGLLVRMKSERLGVIMQNGKRGFRVRIKLFYDIAAQDFMAPHEITIDDAAPKDEIVNEEKPEDWDFSSWPSLRDSLLSDDTRTARAA